MTEIPTAPLGLMPNEVPRLYSSKQVSDLIAAAQIIVGAFLTSDGSVFLEPLSAKFLGAMDALEDVIFEADFPKPTSEELQVIRKARKLAHSLYVVEQMKSGGLVAIGGKMLDEIKALRDALSKLPPAAVQEEVEDASPANTIYLWNRAKPDSREEWVWERFYNDDFAESSEGTMLASSADRTALAALEQCGISRRQLYKDTPGDPLDRPPGAWRDVFVKPSERDDPQGVFETVPSSYQHRVWGPKVRIVLATPPKPVLMIFMRLDLPSLNAGKAIAQGSHASNQMYYDLTQSGDAALHRMLREWSSMARGFGTALTFGANDRQIKVMLERAKEAGIPAEYVHDDTYPLKDGPYSYKVPMDTCAYAFGYKRVLDKAKLTEGLQLYP